MGKADTITKAWMSRSEIFADVFNFYIYDGEQVIRPEDLISLDTTEIALPGADKPDPDSADPVQEYRDVLKSAAVKMDGSATYLILGIENQTVESRIMPVRTLVYDALQYERQIRDLAALHRREKDYRGHTAAEYLSGFYEEDRIRPVITLVVYFGTEPWTAPRSLVEMMEPQKPEIMQFVQDYKLHLIEPLGLSDADLKKFRTEFGTLMKFLRVFHDREKLQDFLQNDRSVRKLGTDTAMVMAACTSLKIPIDRNEEVMDMSNAWEELLEEREARGRVEGRVEGRAEGRMEGRAEGEARGESRGRVKMLYELVLDQLLSLKDAAARAGKTEKEFEADLQAYAAERA